MIDNQRKLKIYVIFTLFVTGFGTCGVATTMGGNNGFDAIFPGIIGFCLIASGVVYLIVDLVTSFIIKRDKQLKANNGYSDLSKDDLNKILLRVFILSIVSTFSFIVLHTIQIGGTMAFYFISTSIILSVFSLVYIGFVKWSHYFKYVWILALAYLLLNAIMAVIAALGNWYIFGYLAIAITYLYCLKLLTKIKF